MPNPKLGTVTTELAKIIKELKAGKIEFKMDKQSEVKGPVGKLSFNAQALAENIRMFIETVMNSSPKLQRIQNIKSISISSTMGPGVMLDKNQFVK
jgi:large subunit ribosomal protein L1